MPFPFVFRPLRVSPLPLKASHFSPPFDILVSPDDVAAKAPDKDDPGLDETGVDSFKSIFSFEAIVDGGAAFGRSGSLYPTGAAKSTSRSVSRTLIPPPPGWVSMINRSKTMVL